MAFTAGDFRRYYTLNLTQIDTETTKFYNQQQKWAECNLPAEKIGYFRTDTKCPPNHAVGRTLIGHFQI